MLEEKYVMLIIKKIHFQKEEKEKKIISLSYPMEFFVGGNL